MPYPNEHSARVKSPGAFQEESFRRKTIDAGVAIIIGRLKGVTTTTTQAYRFDAKKFSAAEARAWLKKHDVKYISFEPATGDAGAETYRSAQDAKGEWCGESFQVLEAGEVEKLGLAKKITPAKGVDVEALTRGDSQPFFVYARALVVGVSENKRRYAKKHQEAFLKALPLYGYLGHPPKTEDWYEPYRDWVTVWIGGVIDGDWLYVKGYVPAESEYFRRKIERSLAAGKPMTVSIWALMELKPRNNGITDVGDITPKSIDWAPPGEEGVKGAQVVGVSGEGKHQEGEVVELTRADVLESLTIVELKRERPDVIQELEGEFKKGKEFADLTEKVKRLETVEGELAKLKTAGVKAHRTALLGEIKDEGFRKVADGMLRGETVEDLDKNFEAVKKDLGEVAKRQGIALFGEVKQNDKKPSGEEKKGEPGLSPRYAPKE